MSELINRIAGETLPWGVVPKPQTHEGHRVMGWGVWRGECARLGYSQSPQSGAVIRQGRDRIGLGTGI